MGKRDFLSFILITLTGFWAHGQSSMDTSDHLKTITQKQHLDAERTKTQGQVFIENHDRAPQYAPLEENYGVPMETNYQFEDFVGSKSYSLPTWDSRSAEEDQ